MNGLRLLVIDDRAAERDELVYLLGSDPGVGAIQTAASGEGALRTALSWKPDLILIDAECGETARRIMTAWAVPILMLAPTADDDELRRRARQVGAVALVKRPDPRAAAEGAALLRMVRLMAEVPVVRRYPGSRPATDREPAFAAVAIGASTGGPQALRALLAELPQSFPAPVLIVQHMAPGFLVGLADWLGQQCDLPVRLAEPEVRPQPGHAYLAPDDRHLELGPDGLVNLSHAPPENGVRPSVSVLFRSLACRAPEVAAVLLTGMGVDGAAELKLLRDRGALTIAQSQASSAVFGMAAAADKLGGARHLLPPDKIAAVLAAAALKRTPQEVP